MAPEREDVQPDRPDRPYPEGAEKESRSREGEGVAGSGSEPASIEELEREVARLRAREEELLRALAELANVQKRRKMETEQTVRHAQESLLRELLPVLDDFERALAAMPARPGDPVRSGVELVQDRLVKILEKEGLTAFRPAGQPFDPNLHDAIGQRPAPPHTPPGTVLDVAQPGYRLRDRILRHPKVVVGIPPALGAAPSMEGPIPRPPDTIPPPLADEDRRGS